MQPGLAAVVVRLIGVAAFAASGVALLHSDGYAQKRLTRLRDLDPQAQTRWEVSLPIGPHARYTILRDRIVTLSEDRTAIRFHGLDGRLLREVPLKVQYSRIAASPRGDRLLASSSLGEDRHFESVLDADGKELWSATLNSTLSFAPSGSFLVTDFNPLASGQSPAAFRAETGQGAWTDASHPVYWNAAAAENDALAYYQRGLLQLIDLPTGALRWQKRIPADPHHDLGRVLISLNGQTIVVQSRVDVDKEEKRLTQVYDAQGNLLWAKQGVPIPGRTNGGVVTRLSDDGGLLAVDDLQEFIILRATDGAATARIPERTECCVGAFTEEMLAFHQGVRTRILRLTGTGAIADDSTLEEPVRFLYRFAAGSPGAVGTARRYVPLVIQRTGQELTLSEIDFSIARSPVSR